MHCCKCGKSITTLYGGMCQGCYNYYKNGGTDNAIPKPGRIEYDYRGCVVCHICGRAFKRLGSHAKESHNMSISEYKRKFELCNNARTTEKSYSKMMHNYAYENDMPEQLKRVGQNTRIKLGEKDKRKGKRVRLQECLDKAERYKGKGAKAK